MSAARPRCWRYVRVLPRRLCGEHAPHRAPAARAGGEDAPAGRPSISGCLLGRVRAAPSRGCSVPDAPSCPLIRAPFQVEALLGAIEAVPMNRGGTSILTRRLLRRHNSRRHPCDDVVVGLCWCWTTSRCAHYSLLTTVRGRTVPGIILQDSLFIQY